MTKPLNLMLHCGAAAVDRQAVEDSPTPKGTDKWHPIPHKSLINLLEMRLPEYGMQVVEQAHGLYKDGMRYFGMFQVDAINETDEPDKDFSMVFGLRNSHDKSFAAGLCLGSGVFVCDNLAFSAEIVLGRRHTRYIMQDLPRIVATALGKLFQARIDQERRLDVYKETELTDDQAAHFLMKALESKAINTTRLPKVWEQWKNPNHPEFAQDKTAWRLFNAFTEVLKDSSLVELPSRTTRLHGLIDSECGFDIRTTAEKIQQDVVQNTTDAIVAGHIIDAVRVTNN